MQPIIFALQLRDKTDVCLCLAGGAALVDLQIPSLLGVVVTDS